MSPLSQFHFKDTNLHTLALIKGCHCPFELQSIGCVCISVRKGRERPFIFPRSPPRPTPAKLIIATYDETLH